MFFKLTMMTSRVIFFTIFASGVSGYINIASILERADDPCDLNEDFSSFQYRSNDLETRRNILDNLNYTAADLFSHYQQIFGCNYVDALQTVKDEMNLSDSSTFATEVKAYYTWLLWAQEAENYLDSLNMGNPSFELLKLDETVNLMMQLACLMFNPNIDETVNHPPIIESTDPIDFRSRSCQLFQAVSNFAHTSLSVTLGRGRRSNIRSYKVLELNPSPLQFNEDIHTTTKPMMSIPDSQLIDLWTHVKVGRNRQVNDVRAAIPKINWKSSPIRKWFINLKIKQN